MSRRRPTIEVFFALLDEIKDRTGSDTDSVRPLRDLDVIFGPGFRNYKPHPLSTDFGLETLVQHLQNELRKKKAKEQELEDNPQLAAAESEKQHLRRVVNSGRPIVLDICNGRLKVRTMSVTRRTQSTPASEGDNEFSRRRARAHSTSGSGSSKRYNRLSNQHVGSDNQASYPLTTQNLDLLQSNNACSINQCKRTPNDVSAMVTAALRQGRTDRDYNDMIHDDRGSSIQNFNVGSMSKDSIPVQGSNSVTNPPTLESPDPLIATQMSPDILRDFTSQTNSEQSSATSFSRTLSFEKHTDGIRHSTRAAIEGPLSSLSTQKTKIHGRDDDDSSRIVPPRRKAVWQGFGTNFDSEAQENRQPFPVDITSQRQMLLASPQHDFHRSEDVAGGSPMLSFEEVIASDDSQPLSSETFSNRASESIHYSGVLADPMHLLPTSLTRNGSRKKATSSRRVLTGKDTFYSASSDENSTLSDQDEPHDMQPDREEGGDLNKHKYDAGNCTDGDVTRPLVNVFDYNKIVPELLPANIRQARNNCEQIWSVHGLDQQGQPDPDNNQLWYSTQFTVKELSPHHQNLLGAPDKHDEYPRTWNARMPPRSANEPPNCIARSERHEFSDEILDFVCSYLSSQEMRSLRLVNRATAKAVLPHIIRSVVFNFGPTLFASPSGKDWDTKSDSPATDSILNDHGREINRFGISFDFDPTGFANAEPKSVEEVVNAWFGNYVWPLEKYPHFQQLKDLEDLVDANRPLLRNTMKNLTKVTELAISVDSGHGWLDGPDISDLAILRAQRTGGSKVFGKRFAAPDKLQEIALREYFLWAQSNTLNSTFKRVTNIQEQFGLKKRDARTLRKYRVCPYDSFMVQKDQRDFNRNAHVGGEVQTDQAQVVTAPANAPAAAPPPGPAGGWGFALPNNNNASDPVTLPPNIVVNTQANAFANVLNMADPNNGPVALQPVPPALMPLLQLPPAHGNIRSHRRNRPGTDPRAFLDGRIVPQWPLIFNCYNLAAEVCGSQAFIQNQVASPADFPYMPGELSETQVQWLMETVWAQRAFLSAYTNSIVSNVGVFKEVHSVHIAKLSSGLISAVAQRDFWTALPNLKKLTLMVSPDWRQEHVPGDKFFHRTMPISPVHASAKLAELLHVFIDKIENLSVLRTGFVAGGEHQTGLFARNRHVLPAPVTLDPQAWLTDHSVKPNPNTMFAFNHVRELTFENCWFSPCMLEGFMRRSRDTSLHHLILDSVSLTGVHDTRHDGPQTTENSRLKCDFSPSEWFLETIPRSACWVNVLENITPGRTILARKYDAKLIDEEEHPRREPFFRGNIKKITLNSCGYVKIGGLRLEQFCQNGLIEQSSPWQSMDEGLEARKKLFYVGCYHKSPTQRSVAERVRQNQGRRGASREIKDEAKKCIMMSTKDPENQNEYFGLGKLTQCVHPVEKRVLERAWGMRFGWGDDMERWAAVEDGWFEGGTGRFSGTIERDHDYDGI